jgi:hypothetical protein
MPPNVPASECAWVPRHLAVGLAQAGFAVTATDASSAMTSRTASRAERHGVGLTAAPVTWDELELAREWSARHRLHVAVALLDAGDEVETVAEELDYWPFRHEELLDDLDSAGLRVRTTTYESDVDRYAVVAYRDA